MGYVRGCKSKPDTGKGIHVSSEQEAAVIMAYLRSKSSGNRVKASVGSKTRSSDPSVFRIVWRRKAPFFMCSIVIFFNYLCNYRKVNFCSL